MSNAYVRIANIAYDTTQGELHRLCSTFGRLSRFEYNQDAGTAMVYFDHVADAEKALFALRGHVFNGRILRVSNNDLHRSSYQDPPPGQACFRCNRTDHVVRNCPVPEGRPPFKRVPRRVPQRDLYPPEPEGPRDMRRGRSRSPDEQPREHISTRRESHDRGFAPRNMEEDRHMTVVMEPPRHDIHDVDDDEEEERDFRRAFDEDAERRDRHWRDPHDSAVTSHPASYLNPERPDRRDTREKEREPPARSERRESHEGRDRKRERDRGSESERKRERTSDRSHRESRRHSSKSKNRAEQRETESNGHREAERAREVSRQEDRRSRLEDENQEKARSAEGRHREVRTEDRGTKRKERSPPPEKRQERENTPPASHPAPSREEPKESNRSIAAEQRVHERVHDNNARGNVQEMEDDDDLHAVPASPENLSPLRDEVPMSTSTADTSAELKVQEEEEPNGSQPDRASSYKESNRDTHRRFDSWRPDGARRDTRPNGDYSRNQADDRYEPRHSERMPDKRRERTRRAAYDERRRR